MTLHDLCALPALYRRIRVLDRDLAEHKDKYANTVLALRIANDRVEMLASRDAAQQLALKAADELVGALEAERDDARREVDEVRAALVWLEGEWFKKGGVG